MTTAIRLRSIVLAPDERRPAMAAESDTPILDLLAKMTADSLEATTLDGQTTMVVRIAALVAIDAPPASYLLNMGVAGESGVDADMVQGILAAVAPIVGTSRVVSAAGKMVRALGLKLDLAELADEE
jgi:4-carboxymuconolactone decarboxylase